MGIFDRIKAAVSRKPRQGTGLEATQWKQAPPRRGSRELIRAYKEMPWLKKVVDTSADSVGRACWKVLRLTDKAGQRKRDFSLRAAPFESRWRRLNALAEIGEVEEVPDHNILRLLSDPNDFFTGPQFWALVDKYLGLVGEAFLVMEKVGKVPVGLWAVPPHAMTRLPDLSLPRSERTYTVNMGGMVADVPADIVIHLRHLDPEDPLGRGVGTGFALGDELDSDEYVARFVKNSFFNQMVPPFIIGIEGGNFEANAPGLKRWKEELSRTHGGPDNAGKALITNGKLTAQRLDTTFKDIALVDLRKFLMDFVRMTYGIPPEIVGDISSSNKATSFAAMEHFATQVTVPRLEFLRAALQKWLLPLFDDETAILDFESPVPADREHRLRVMGTMPAAFSYDEWRGLADFKPDPERQGYPMPLPGQKPEGNPTPDAGGDTAPGAAEEGKAPAKGDPPWAAQPLR